MDEQLAKVVIGAVFLVGLVVWMIAVTLYRKMADAPQVERFESAVPGKTPAEAIKAVVEGARRLTAQARMSRPDERTLEIVQLGVTSRIVAERQGGQTVLVAEVDDSSMRRKMQIAMAILVLVVAPAAVLGVSAALWYFAAPSPAPAVRWQCVQALQMSHALWPPFLVYFLWKKQRAMVADSTSNLLVLADTG
jgi:hypothetical protein